MQFRVSGIIRESVVDGPGLRSVIFAQGCPRRCPGCHNPDSLDPDGGTLMDVDEVIAMIIKIKLISGVTFSGGEPFMQAGAFAKMADVLSRRGLNIMTYTGYTWEELLEMTEKDEEINALLERTDYLVEGPFIEAQKDLNLPFRGSRNQRIINVQESLRTKGLIPVSFA